MPHLPSLLTVKADVVLLAAEALETEGELVEMVVTPVDVEDVAEEIVDDIVEVAGFEDGGDLRIRHLDIKTLLSKRTN